MKKLFQAQSTLELIMVIILVLAGIFVMGPYVVRSVNAYMRSWEISVSQANSNPNVALDPSEIPGSVPPPPPPIHCNLYSNPTDCGSHSECMWVLEHDCAYCGQPGEYCDLYQSFCADNDPSGCSSYNSSPQECCIQDGPCFSYGNPCGI